MLLSGPDCPPSFCTTGSKYTVHEMYHSLVQYGRGFARVVQIVDGGVVVTPGRHTKWYPRYTRYTRRM